MTSLTVTPAKRNVAGGGRLPGWQDWGGGRNGHRMLLYCGADPVIIEGTKMTPCPGRKKSLLRLCLINPGSAYAYTGRFQVPIIKSSRRQTSSFFPVSQVLLAFSPSTIFSTSPNPPLIVIYTTLLNYTPVISPYPTYYTCLRTSEPADK
jgi:hypothetical protein